MLDAMFQAADYRTATYTSPHLLRYNERIHLEGREVSDRELCAAFSRIESVRGETSLTYFEYGTLAALDLFFQTQPDVAILEVGLGGRLDATNVLDADVAVVTTIDLDHREWLGPDRESVGREKAGIFRAGRPAICGDPHPPDSVVEQAALVGATLHVQGRDFGGSLVGSEGFWNWWGMGQTAAALPAPRLVGQHQYQNAATARMAIECFADRLPVPEAAVRHALESVAIPARFQVLPGSIPCILDVAHNPQAVTALATSLKKFSTGRTLAVVGMLADKDIIGTLGALVAIIDKWYPATLAVPRGATADRLVEALASFQVIAAGAYADVPKALAAARSQATIRDRIVVFGSFHTVASVL